MSRYGLIGLAVCVVVAGCGPITVSGTSVTLAAGHGSISWSDSHDDNPASPFRVGNVMYAGHEFVMWGNWEPLGETSVGGGTSCSVTTHFADGTPLAARCESPHRRAGPVTIGDEKFDLADGNLFLITGPSDRPRVKQLKRDLSGVNMKDRKSLQVFGEADAEVVAFFTQK